MLVILFNQLLKTKVSPALIAKTITLTTKNIAAHHKIKTNIRKEDYAEVLAAFYKEKISKDAIEQALTLITKGQTVAKAIAMFKSLNKSEIEKIIKNILKKHPKLKENQKALMGIVMQQLRGKADGKVIIEILRKLIK